MKANAQKQCRGTYFPQIAKLQILLKEIMNSAELLVEFW